MALSGVMETTIITKASIEDLDLVNEFLIANFFSREPLGVRMGIDPERDTRSWISMVTLPLLSQEASFSCHKKICSEQVSNTRCHAFRSMGKS